MGHTLSRLLSPLIRFIWKKVSALVDVEIAGLVGSPSFWRNDLSETLLSPSFKNLKSEMTNLQMKISSYFEKTEAIREANEEKDTAATKLQKVYKSYRTRRNLADCAVVVEELWWKAQDFASLSSSSILFFRHEKPETAVSRWSRARTRAARVGKGLSKDEKAQKLALRHWLEAIDPRHRYGHNLHFYYEIWFNSESSEPFFYWLDIGGGKEVNLEKCSRSKLQHQCIRYLGPKERKAYEVIVEDGKLVFKQTLDPINSVDGSKWIFVLSTSRKLYVGQKEKGRFQHSSFLAGGATTSAGRLVAVNGVLRAIWPYSGHYLPTEENFKEFINFLTEKRVDLTNVKKYSIDEDDFISFGKRASMTEDSVSLEDLSGSRVEEAGICYDSRYVGPALGMSGPMSCQWSTGVGPRIGCVRDYPVDLQCLALEKVNLSPRTGPTLSGNNGPIPSPRPSPRLRLSPRLSHMGIPGPSTFLSQPKSKRKMENINIPSPRVSLCLHESKDAVGISGLSPGLSPYFAEAENGGDHMNFQSPMVILSLPKSRKRVGQVGIPSPRAFFSPHESRSTGDPMGIIALSPSVSPSPPKADNRGEHVNIRSPKISPT